MKKPKILNSSAGQFLVEIILAIGLSVIILPALFTGILVSREGKAQQKERLVATTLLRESEEAIRNVREKGWITFAVNGTYHPAISGSSWSLVSGSEVINGFTRSIIISDAYRDLASGTIITSGGILDPSTKKIVTTISWNTPLPSNVQTTIYLTRTDNLSYTETTDLQFNKGVPGGTSVIKTYGDGEIILGSGGQGDWCKPNLSLQQLDLPKSGAANGLWAIEGQAFAGTGDNASGVSFANIQINNANPPVMSITGTFDSYKTNDVFGEKDYAYLATDTNSKEVVIINLNNLDPVTKKYSEAGYFDAPGNGNTKAVTVANDIGFTTVSNHLYSFDLRAGSGGRNGSRPMLGQYTMAGTGNRIKIVGNYAYIAVQQSSIKLVVVNISNPKNMTLAGQTSINVPDSQDIAVKPDGTRAYVATTHSQTWTLEDVFIIDTSSHSGSLPIVGRYNTMTKDDEGMTNPHGISLVTGNHIIVVGYGNQEYQVIDIKDEKNPVKCGGMHISTTSGISSVLEQDGDAYSYIITTDADSELKIVEGGPGGKYSTNGVFTSYTFDSTAEYQTAYNRFQVTIDRPPSTNIEFQVGVANAINNSCVGVSPTFVGPDGTNGSRFQTTVTTGQTVFSYSIPPSINPGRCFAYKVFLTTIDASTTPIVYQIDVNYSP